LNILEDSRLSAGGLGVLSLLEGLLAAEGLAFSLPPFPKKSFALEGLGAFVSCLMLVAGLMASLVSVGLGWPG